MHTEFINSYLQFLNDKEALIKNNLNITSSNNCYLVDELWNDELLQNVNAIINNNKKKSNSLYNNYIKTNFLFPKRKPRFINGFFEAINYINNNMKFRLMNKSLIEYLYKNNNSLYKNARCIQYYGKNNKLILDFEEKNLNYSLLTYFYLIFAV